MAKAIAEIAVKTYVEWKSSPLTASKQGSAFAGIASKTKEGWAGEPY